MKPRTASQTGTGGKSSAVRYAVGSGSRPKGGSMPIPSSAPAKQQKIR